MVEMKKPPRMGGLGVKMNPVGGWLLISWLLKKAFDHKDRYISEEEYNRLWAEAEASKKVLYEEEPKLLPGPKEVR